MFYNYYLTSPLIRRIILYNKAMKNIETIIKFLKSRSVVSLTLEETNTIIKMLEEEIVKPPVVKNAKQGRVK